MLAFFKGFTYAAKGIKTAFLEERNMRFHFCAGFYVFLFSLFYPFGKIEYLILFIIVAGVLSLEMVNSALERVVDKPTPAKYKIAGDIKDIGAGAVLLFCIAAAACGVILFWDISVFKKIYFYFTNNIFMLVLLFISLVFCFWLVFLFGKPKKQNKS